METREMTLVTIVAERLLKKRVLEGIRSVGARGWTLTDVTGEGDHRISAHEWEGPSVKVETLVTEEVAGKILKLVAGRYFEHHAVVVFTSTVRVIREGKFRDSS